MTRTEKPCPNTGGYRRDKRGVYHDYKPRKGCGNNVLMRRLYMRERIIIEGKEDPNAWRPRVKKAQRYIPVAWYCPKCKHFEVDPPRKATK